MTVKARRTTQHKGRSKRLISLLMAIVLTAGLLPAPAAMAENADKPKAEQDDSAELMDAWYQPHIDKLAGWGVMKGDGNGNMRPDDSITRAEYVAMVNRAFGYKVVSPTNFTDVYLSDWFYDDIGIAYGAGYFKGGAYNMAYPNDTLSREEAAVIMARNMRLQPVAGESTSFTDGRELSYWAKGLVEAAAREGIISGYADGSFHPDNSITRAEMASMLAKAVNTLIQTPGEESLGSVYGNLTINTSGVTLKDTVVAGNLYITGGLGLGAVTLENVTVLGKIVVSGAGEANKGDDSVILRNTNAQELILDSIANNFTTIRAEGIGTIDRAEVRTRSFIRDVCPSDQGIKLIDVRGSEGLEVQLAGNIKEVVDYTPYSKLILTEGRAETVTIDEEATGATMEITLGSTVNTLNLDTAATITGKGDINRLNVNAAGCVVEMLPDYITIRPGITAIIAGETMDTTTAMESSASPRIIAGYPAVKDVAPTSATTVFRTNKKGTVYWALTAIADGSVTEEDLINPPVYGGSIIKSDKFEMPASNTDQTIPLTELLKDGSYYVSAVLVDNRDQRSPVKVAAFTTPDDSTPEFATEPKLIGVTHEDAFVTVMPTKSCQLYYAVLPKGAVAPTIPEFKAGAISGNLGYGSVAVTKNTSSTFQVNNTTLEELTDYVLYLLLMDADGSKNSGIKTINFTTPDGTPPYFIADLSTKEIGKDTLTFTATVNEDATVYWVAVPAGEDYPVPQPGQSTSDLRSEYAKIQVENGMGSGKIVSTGNMKATGNKQFELKVTGLQESTSYDIYYIAKDLAGNYSAEVKRITKNTLDNTPPKVTQEFTKLSGSQPLADTDIKLIFDEAIMFDAEGVGEDLRTMYDNYAKGSMSEAEAMEFIKLFEDNIVLMDDDSIIRDTRDHIKDPADTKFDTMPAWVDYTRIKITMEDGKTIITFPGGEALKLASGGNYHFKLTNICDISDNRNKMGTVDLPKFTVAFAQVTLVPGTKDIPSKKETVGGEEKETIRIDMTFTMKPQSTETVADSVCYDMFLWCSTNIRFDLYMRALDKDGNPIDPAANPKEMSMFKEVKGDILEGGWIKVNSGDTYCSAGSDGTGAPTAQSIYNLIHPNANSYPKLNSLNSDYTYEFAIEVTTIGSSSDYEFWSDNVEIRVTIPAGDGVTVRNLSQKARSEGALKNWNDAIEGSDDVSSIGLTTSGQDNFTVKNQFRNTSLPTFDGGHPQFIPTDQDVDMKLMLSMPGTVYYIVAQEKSIATEYAPKDPNDPSGDKYSYNDIPKTGEKYKDGTDDIDGVERSTKVITKPNAEWVVDYVERNKSNTESEIKVGVTEQDSSLKTEKVSDLEPLTKYIVYFVLKGVSEKLSDVYCFRFETGKVTTPTIGLTTDNAIVYITTSTNAEGRWIFFPEKNAGDDKSQVKFTQDFFGTAANLDDDWTATTTNTNITLTKKDGTKIEIPLNPKNTDGKYTIIDALLTSMSQNDNTSLFDKFASQTLKQQLNSMVQGSNSAWQYILSSGNVETERNVQKAITSFQEEMKEGVAYYVVAAMKNTASEEDTEEYAFKAVGNVIKADTKPPELSGLECTVDKITGKDGQEVDTWINKNPTECKYDLMIKASFDEVIYMRELEGSTWKEVVTSVTPGSTGDNDKVALKGIIDCFPANVTMANVNGSIFQVVVRNVRPGSSIIFFSSGYISDAAGNNYGENGRLIIKLTVKVNSNGLPVVSTTYDYGGKSQTDVIYEAISSN